MTNRRNFVMLAGAAGLLPGIVRAQASTYPNKPIKLIVGFSPGQGSDIYARRLAQNLTEVLGRPVVVDNHAGAGGQLANADVAKAEPDGYTLLMATAGGVSTAAAFYREKMTTNVLKDLVPVCTFLRVSQNLVSSKLYKPTTFAEFIADARARPGQIAYGSAGVGTTGHLAMAALANRAKLDLIHVPYKGNPPAYQDMLSGRISVMFDNTTGALPFTQNNQVNVLAVGSPIRVPLLPNVPSISELGYAPFDARAWTGFMAPAGTPPEVIKKLYDAVVTVMAKPEIIKWAADQGGEIFVSDAAQFAPYLRAEIAKWTEVVQQANIRPE